MHPICVLFHAVYFWWEKNVTGVEVIDEVGCRYNAAKYVMLHDALQWPKRNVNKTLNSQQAFDT